MIDALLSAMAVIVSGYTLIAGGHFVIQLVFAHLEHRRQSSRAFGAAFPFNGLDVDVVLPVYNEAPDELDACIKSILAQEHGGRVRLIVVDDCSTNRAALEPVYERCRAAGATVILAARNGGKREAQYLAFRHLRGDVVVTVDSDTRLEPLAIARLTRRFADPRIGAVTADVAVTNARRNILTRLIGMRYWMAFHQERAAQSWFRSVLCCSGPLSAYRRAVVELVKDDYINQTFRGAKCVFGDDRHLTNLVLARDFDTVFDGAARATTNAPETIRAYLRQQLRWNKSFYRELPWTAPFLLRRPWYMWLDVVAQTTLPLLLTLAVSGVLITSVLVSPWQSARWVAVVVAIALVRATYAVLRERRAEFYLFVLYGFIHAGLLLPTRLFALLTLSDNRWGTR